LTIGWFCGNRKESEDNAVWRTEDRMTSETFSQNTDQGLPGFEWAGSQKDEI
jgi:hypothetical protein